MWLARCHSSDSFHEPLSCKEGEVYRYMFQVHEVDDDFGYSQIQCACNAMLQYQITHLS